MAPFDLFVVLAEMRTGSNFLETNLNALPGVTCHGEAFNPDFLGQPKWTDILGISREQRDAAPLDLVEAIRQTPGTLGGFRYFHDHDPRLLAPLLVDPRCAKIVLTRNPLETYVSLKIAMATDIWRMTNPRRQQLVVPVADMKVHFDAEEFERHLEASQAFQLTILKALQASGQTAFYIGYEDLFELEILNGLAAFLGLEARLGSLDRTLKKQNPGAITDKVDNPDEMEAALCRLDRFNLWRTPNFEPRRGPSVQTWLTAPASPLLFQPIEGGPVEAVAGWLSALDGGGAPGRTHSKPSLRKWLQEQARPIAFSVLRHPLQRAHAIYCRHILQTGPGAFPEIRRVLGQHFGADLPESPDAPGYDAAAHRAGFLRFLRFIRANLGGQTGQRTDAGWASQCEVLRGFAEWAPCELVLREDELAGGLAALAARVGRPAPALGETDPWRERLAAIVDDELQKAARLAYPRDYEIFGFRDWA